MSDSLDERQLEKQEKRIEALERELERLRRTEAAAKALVDAWYSGEEGPAYLALRDAVYQPDEESGRD